jgi:isopentenyl phosphate kinase
MKERIVIKFGGSSLTFNKKPKDVHELIDTPENFIRFEDIKRYAKEVLLANMKRKMELFIFHGVNQYGHFVVEVLGITSKVRKYCKFLSDIFVEIFRRYLPVEQVDLAKFCRWNEKLKIFEFLDYLRKISRIAENGGIPVSFGTVVNKIPKGYAIISGDDAFLYTGLMLKAKEGIMYVDVPICHKNPKKWKNAKLVKILDSHENIEIDVENYDKTGGLIGKIKKLEILALNGVKCQIVDAFKEGNVYKSLIGKNVGTLIKPKL